MIRCVRATILVLPPRPAPRAPRSRASCPSRGMHGLCTKTSDRSAPTVVCATSCRSSAAASESQQQQQQRAAADPAAGERAAAAEQQRHQQQRAIAECAATEQRQQQQQQQQQRAAAERAAASEQQQQQQHCRWPHTPSIIRAFGPGYPPPGELDVVATAAAAVTAAARRSAPGWCARACMERSRACTAAHNNAEPAESCAADER